MSPARRLYLLRHAKSSWDEESVPDVERPLSPRGVRAAAALSRYVESRQLKVDLVLCSPAVRTRQTWHAVSDAFGTTAEIVFDAAIYEASPDDLLRVLHSVVEGIDSVLIIGHNPGLGALAAGLPRDGTAPAVARLRAGFPTGAFASLTLDVPWSELARDTAYLADFVRPRDLPG